MPRKSLDSDTRGTRYPAHYEQRLIASSQKDLPVPVVSLIEYVQAEFDYIEQRQKEAQAGGGALAEYEAQLVLALTELKENFSYLVLRQMLEALFSDILSADRIVAIPAGEPIISQAQAGEIKLLADRIKHFTQDTYYR